MPEILRRFIAVVVSSALRKSPTDRHFFLYCVSHVCFCVGPDGSQNKKSCSKAFRTLWPVNPLSNCHHTKTQAAPDSLPSDTELFNEHIFWSTYCLEPKSFTQNSFLEHVFLSGDLEGANSSKVTI